MDQASHELKATTSTTDKNLPALAWKIATQPRLYRVLAINPYCRRSRQIGLELFPDADITDTIKAVVLAEPEGRYDRYFKLLPHWLQAAEIKKQVDQTAEIESRLNQYYEQNKVELAQLPPEFLYDILFNNAFETSDPQEVEQRFSQKQRLDYKLLIDSLIARQTKQTIGPEIPNLEQLEVETPIPVKAGKKRRRILPSKRSLLIACYACPAVVLSSFLVLSALAEQNVRLPVLQPVISLKTQFETQVAGAGYPVRLQIPKLHVDASVEYTGINSKGEMEVPYNVRSVGWYKLGPKPGENGNAIITGHLDEKKGETGVFNNLDKLKEGDKFFIRDGSGKILSFLVQGSKIYNPGYADEVFYPSDNNAHLNLISCDGVWDEAKKSYSKRLVVFAIAENSEISQN